MFGDIKGGNLGIRQKVHENYIAEIVSFGLPKKIVGISSGLTHSLAWDCEGKIYSWGSGVNGKLGHPIPFHLSNKPVNEIYPR